MPIYLIRGILQTGNFVSLCKRTTYAKLKQKEEEKKGALCSNWLLVCNLPHEEES